LKENNIMQSGLCPCNSKLVLKRREFCQQLQEKNLQLDANPGHNLNMISADMPFDQNKLSSNRLIAIHTDRQDISSLNQLFNIDLKVEIPKRKKVEIIEITNPFNRQSISLNYHPDDMTSVEESDVTIWNRSRKMILSAFHSSFTNKYSIKIEMFDGQAHSIGTLETEMHHNPGHYCFFCVDYCPERFEVKKGLNISCISPYCNCCSKSIYDYNANKEEKQKKLGKIKSSLFSDGIKITNSEGESIYKLTNGNSWWRSFRFLVEAPFLPFCIPYKLSICCCLDIIYAGKSDEIRLYDYKEDKEFHIGVSTNHVERANKWEEVMRNGEKVNKYKGEEMFICKQFEVNMPDDITQETKKLIIGALIAEIPSTIDRCAC